MITHKQRRTEKGLCFKHYFKWIFCFSFTLYFLVSFLVDHDHEDLPLSPSSLTRPNTLQTNPKTKFIASHAVFESKIHDHTLIFPPQRPNIRADVFNNLKIYVYDLPSKFNTDWLANNRCSNHLFAAEVALHKALLSLEGKDVRTEDPYEADFFFVPVYVSCNFSTLNGFPAIGHARSLIEEAIGLVSAEYPFWNRTSGSDHVFTATHDFGSCFHTMEDRAIADGVPVILRNSIVLQTFGVTFKHPCQEVENVVIPPYISPVSLHKTQKNVPVTKERDIRVFFRGKMEIHPKNISGRFYSKRVRTEIWRRYGSDRRFYLQRQRFAGYQSEIARSVFCLCPLGWAPWSPRLVESVALGCVPVIIADGIRLPFPSAVRWQDISLTVAERDVGKLGEILEHVAATNLSVIQKNLEDPSVKRALLFNVPPQEGDATWQVLEALSKKLHRLRLPPHSTLKQRYRFVIAKYKDCYLVYILTEMPDSTSMIFTRTCDGTRLIALMLRSLGFRAIPISGQMTQSKRLGALNKFKAGECNTLVCTDVASRGLDIPSVDMVINSRGLDI